MLCVQNAIIILKYRNMSVPYMWSKRKSSSKIVNMIKNFSKWSDKVVIDLFTGWFAISEEFIKSWYKTISNDKNKYVVALIDKVVNKWLDKEKCLEWVSRELFKDVLDNPDNYEDWYVWYVMCIWSFWNNQKGYLFWEDNERIKKQLFNMVVHKIVSDEVKEIIPNKKYIDFIIRQNNWSKRRLALKKVINKLNKRFDLESLERLQSLESLERLERLEEVILHSWDYRDIEIPKKAIVYCDPPYQWTATYREWWFNHEEFWDYMRKLSKTNKVFISEYNAPDDFICIYEFSQKSTLWKNQSHRNQPNEKLFTI